ncbi:hypothetical protein CTI14_13410, partial [Methylobacterium radiotolerans]
MVFPRWGLDGKQLRTVIMGTQDAPAAMSKRGIYGAAMIWEYIRLFMREGAAAVPAAAPHLEYRLQRPLDAFRHFNPLKILRVKIWWYPVAVPFFLFVALPLAPVAIIGDLLYYALDRVLPRRKWPQGLIEACDSVGTAGTIDEKATAPKNEHSVLYSRVEALRPDGPLLSVAPAADNNLMRMTEDCLFIADSFWFSLRWTGKYELVGVLTSVFCLGDIFRIRISKLQKNQFPMGRLMVFFFEFYLQNWYVSFGMSLFMLIGSLWLFVPWRRQLPIVFNRKTKAVSFFHEGKVVSEDWS